MRLAALTALALHMARLPAWPRIVDQSRNQDRDHVKTLRSRAHAARPASVPKPATVAVRTAQEAADFIAKVETDLVGENEYANRVAWVAATFITEDTELALRQGLRRARRAGGRPRQRGRDLRSASTVDPVTRRKLDLLKKGLSLPPPDRPGAAEELANIEYAGSTRPIRPPRSAIRARSSPSTTSRTSCAPRAIRPSSRRSGRAGTPSRVPCATTTPGMVEPRQRRRARARLAGHRRAVALLVRHAARRIRPNGRAPVVAARAAVPEPALLCARPAERKIRRRRAAAQRADPRRPARRHVGAELGQHLRPAGAEERRASATTSPRRW